jgi:DNA repair protein RadD
VNGKTASKERSTILAQYKASQFKYLVNVGCFTTGFDQKDIDGLVFMRPTASAGLYVQMCGRGMRVHASKTDCLVLDYVGNIETHGPVTHVEPPPPPRESNRENAPSVKECPECHSLLYLAATVCDECGYEFPKQYKVQTRAASANIMAKVDIREHQISGYKAVIHTKRNAPDMIKITWKSGMLPICDQYLCINHQGYARQKAVEWFARWTGRIPTGDMNVDLQTIQTMPEPPVLIKVDHGGKYPEIRNWI